MQEEYNTEENLIRIEKELESVFNSIVNTPSSVFIGNTIPNDLKKMQPALPTEVSPYTESVGDNNYLKNMIS